MSTSLRRRRSTTSLIAPAPPGFTSALGAYPSGEALQLTADDERVLDQIWAERAGRHQQTPASSGQTIEQAAPEAHARPPKRSRRHRAGIA